MINYIIICSLILITIYLIYRINLSFENKNTKGIESVKVNILSDCIVIISRDNCPYCTLLEEQIVNSKKRYTNIKLTPLGNFKFDDTFTNLEISERDNIIQEVKKIFETGVLHLPTIIVGDKIHIGLPQKEKINEIFN
jgi:glutaredoxin